MLSPRGGLPDREPDAGHHPGFARELYISETTVKTHFLHIYTKLDVADRTAAVTIALARGIIRLS